MVRFVVFTAWISIILIKTDRATDVLIYAPTLFTGNHSIFLFSATTALHCS